MKKMNLLVCASEYYPYGSGIANVAYNVVEQLKKRGVDCTICSPTGPDINLGSRLLIQKFGRLGLLYYWYQVGKYLENNKDFDLVWLHQPLFIKKPFLSNSLMTMHITSFGVSKQIQQSSDYPLFRKIYKNLAAHIEKFCLNRFDLRNTRFSADSLQVYDELKSLGIPEKNISYISNGVDTRLFKTVDSDKKKKLRDDFCIPKDDLILLWVGGLTAIKNPLKLIEMYSLIEKEYESISLVIAGRGKLKNAMRKLSKKIGLKKIIFLGYVHDKKMHDLYACSDVYIMTSIYEGSPLTLLEAMSSGLPCIVSDVASISSVVSDAKAGIIVDFNGGSKAAHQIIDFFNGDISDCGKNARGYVVKNLDWSEITKRYIKEFQKIIDMKG